MYRIVFFLVCHSIFTCRTGTAQVKENYFLQDIQQPVPLPAGSAGNILRLFDTPDGIIAVTPKAIAVYANGKWNSRVLNRECIVAVADMEHRVWVISKDKAWIPGTKKEIALPPPAQKDTILCALWEDNKTLHIGTSGGLYTWNGKWSRQNEINTTRVNDMVPDAQHRLYVATMDGLWRRENNKWQNLDDVVMASANERKYFTLATGNDGADVFFSALRSVGCIAGNGDHKVWSSVNGLPYGPAKMIRWSGNDMWLGTDKGVIKKDTAWHYYNGKRWLSDNQVNDILALKNGAVWIATPEGINEIKQTSITLKQKADSYEQTIALRHNRRGLVNISRLSIPGDLSSSKTQNEDNDGLWTACYLAASCFRYAVTKEPAALESAVRTFEALERLETVSGIPGYPARSYALASDQVVQSRSPHPKHWHSSPDGKWQWLDDTSSDEITGHLFALSLFYELVADDTQKQRVTGLINRIVTHIVDHNFLLIDFDGLPTRWGIWNPDSLNHSPHRMYERGLNSLQILSFLKTAFHYTGNKKFEAAYQTLTEQHGYAKNALYAKMFGPFENSHSDDILNFFPYYGLLRYAEGDSYHPLYVRSLERSWNAVRSDRMPVWNIIASALLGKNCDLDIALRELQQYPLDLIDWSMENSHRWDLLHDPLPDRQGKAQSVMPVPSAESSVSRWNTNPKQLNSGQGGKTEEAGTYFLFAYWMGRYYGFFD